MRAVKEVQEQMKTKTPVAGAGPASMGTMDKLRSYPGRSRQFLHDVRLEMRNVTWPSWKDVQTTTVVVLVATFFFGFYLGAALDVPLARLITWLLRAGRQLVGG